MTFENAQARERTQVLMDIANQTGGLVVGTGDLSELALGWATYNGDHMSMYGVNASIPKTLVRHLVAFVAETRRKDSSLPLVLEDILDTPVSPELLPAIEGEISQKTEDLVGPYELHDFFLYYAIRWAFPPRKVLRLAEYALAAPMTGPTILNGCEPSTAGSLPSSSSAPACPTGPRWAPWPSPPAGTGGCPVTRRPPSGWRNWRGWSKRMNLYLDLFFTFAKIGVCTFGGGYAMLPILQREIVEKRGWATDGELTDYFAIGQCTPGVIAVNTATFVGQKLKGIPGGIAATLGLVFPSIVIIMVIAAFLQNFADLPVVVHAFAGVRACVCALILSSVLKLRKNALVDKPTVIIFAIVLVLAVIGNFVAFDAGTLWGRVLNFLLSPVVLVVASGVAGLCIRGAKGALRK